MLKLKQLQEAKKKKEAEAAAAKAGNKADEPSDAAAAEAAKEKDAAGDEKRENVLTLKSGAGRKGKTRATAAQLRAQKDITEMDPVPGCVLHFPDPNNLMDFTVDITPSDGLYGSAKFNFHIVVPTTYPYDPPKVTCHTPVYHPNIDEAGAVCLNILREDWMPVLNLGSVIFGLLTLFLEPNPDDPLNKDAADEMASKPDQFRRNVERTLRGGSFMGRTFPKLIK